MWFECIWSKKKTIFFFFFGIEGVLYAHTSYIHRSFLKFHHALLARVSNSHGKQNVDHLNNIFGRKLLEVRSETSTLHQSIFKFFFLSLSFRKYLFDWKDLANNFFKFYLFIRSVYFEFQRKMIIILRDLSAVKNGLDRQM